MSCPRTNGPRTNRLRALAYAAVAAGVLAGCTASATSSPTSPAVTHTVVEGTRTATSAPAISPPRPAKSVQPLPPGRAPRAGEAQRACPYIRTGLDEDPAGAKSANVADIEGDRVYRTVVLTRLRPVGCRFYFYAPPYEATAEIRPATYPTATAARDAMVLTARTGTEQLTERDFVAGLTGICYRTAFFGPDGRRDWAFVFAKGRVLVTVYTQRSDTSRNALYLAQAIAAKF
ncbi:hypothetical protein [uncultured Jatrophihabitans sp.]|uniref:hypothetical protein n=1 Tax=uncultured Jatrophihabitans sp. TaxID=1610747 RepID=UPI0035C9BDD1